MKEGGEAEEVEEDDEQSGKKKKAYEFGLGNWIGKIDGSNKCKKKKINKKKEVI